MPSTEQLTAVRHRRDRIAAMINEAAEAGDPEPTARELAEIVGTTMDIVYDDREILTDAKLIPRVPDRRGVRAASNRRVKIMRHLVSRWEKGHPPSTLAEMAERFGVTQKTIRKDLRVLVEAGAIERPAGVPRGIRVADDWRTRTDGA